MGEDNLVLFYAFKNIFLSRDPQAHKLTKGFHGSKHSILNGLLGTCAYRLPGSLRLGSDGQKAVVIIIKEIQLTLEHHGFELHRSTYAWIFFNKYSTCIFIF